MSKKENNKLLINVQLWTLLSLEIKGYIRRDLKKLYQDLNGRFKECGVPKKVDVVLAVLGALGSVTNFL